MGKDSNGKAAGYAIGRTSWYMKTLLNKLLGENESGITYEQWLVLKVIAENPGMSQTEVAEKSQKDKTNITRMIDVLEKCGFIERRKDEHDRRMYRIHATPEGAMVLKRVGPLTQKTEEICTRSLSREQVAELIGLLDVVCSNIKREL